MLKEILKYRDLLFMLTLRDIRIRYKQAAMGFIWALFMPLVAVCAGILIKYAMASVAGKQIDLLEMASISVKVLPWTFFISSIQFSVQSLVGNSSLVTKIYFPKAVLPLASIIACLFDFGIAVVVLAVFLTILKIGVSFHLLWVPILLVFLFLFTAGLGLILAAGNLFFRDVKYVVQTLLTFGIFFVPVFYSASHFEKLGFILMLNPIGSILELINSAVVLKEMPDLFWFTYTAVSCTATFFLGLTIFQKKEPLFAENI